MTDDRTQRHKPNRQRDQVIAKALRNRDETRRKLLAQGQELARRRANNVERSDQRAKETAKSTNVSVHSTMPAMESNEEAAARHSHSNVPAQPKGSTVPAAPRLYGLRLYKRIRPETPKQDATSTEERDADTDHPSDNGGEDCQ